MDQRKDVAFALFNSGFNCAQAVFTTYTDLFEIDAKTSNAIACAFGGGIAQNQLMCGAVSGALMIIGCKYFDEKDHIGSKNIVYRKAQEFIKSFQEKHGSITCLELIGFDFKDKEAKDKAKKDGFFEKTCGKYVKEASLILEKILVCDGVVVELD